MMTEDEIYSIYLEMMNERKEARKLPFEPSRMEFAMKIAEIAYQKGRNDGYSSGYDAAFYEQEGYRL